MTLVDSPASKEATTLIIRADYCYDIVKGKIKHLSKIIVAMDTIFGWCLQGKVTDNIDSLMFYVIEEIFLSEQIKKLETLNCQVSLILNKI